MTQAVLDGDDLEQLLARIAHEARILVDAVSGVVVTVAGRPELMTFRAVDGLTVGALRVGHVMPARDTLTELALIRGTNIVAGDVDEITRAGRAFAAATDVGPLIAAPLATIGTARGVLVVGRPAGSPPFTPADVTLTATFAAQAASAIALSQLRASEASLAVTVERGRIAEALHDGIVRGLRSLRADVGELAGITPEQGWLASVGEACVKLDEAIAIVGEYATELEVLESAQPRQAALARRQLRDRTAAGATCAPTGASPTTDRGSQRTIAILGDLARAAAGDGDTDEVLGSLVEEAQGRSGAAFGVIGIVSERAGSVLVRARAGMELPGRRVGDVVPIGETLVGEAISLGRPVLDEALAMSSLRVAPPIKAQIGPMVVVPMLVRGHRFGAMAIGRAVGGAPFTDTEIRLIEAYGVQAAIALEFERVRHDLHAATLSIERGKIGRELHERVVLLLFGVAFDLEALASTVTESSVRASLQAVVEGLDGAIRDLRRFVFGFGPDRGPKSPADVRVEALAADNARLQSEIEAQLLEVRASRTRIIAAGDAERKRVERDLHDGAQQRLVSLTLALRVARARLRDDVDSAARLSLEQASAEAKAALSELRELARGIHPLILTEAGLQPAIESLASRSPVDVFVDVGDRRFPPAVEGATYFVVSEALANLAKYSQASHAFVHADWAAGELVVEISDDGVGGADPSSGTGLRGLADRLESINGSLEVTSPIGGGTRLLARIPVSAAQLAPA